MAKNWTISEALNEIQAGNKDAIVDIGRRFPLATVAIASDPKKILEALNFITVRKVESILKEGVQPIEDDEDGIEDPKPTTPVEEKKATRGRKAAKKEEPMNEPEEDEEEDDTPDLKKMSEVDLFKLAKKKGLKPEPKKSKKYYIDLITKADEPAEDEDDWDDEEEEEKKPVKKAPAKKAPVKKAPAKKNEDADEDDDWDI